MSAGPRIDKWLWHARLTKTRSLAARLCAEGLVSLAGRIVTRPAQVVRLGDIVTLRHAGWERRVEVLDYGVRRGPAGEARLLYRDASAPIRLSSADPAWVSLFADDGSAEDDETAG
jgi:ribosome-associated heat shock protein Hsp15